MLASPAQAQGLDQATRKGIDAHAFQFSGRHCTGDIHAKPARETVNLAKFKIAVLMMDEIFKELAVEHPKTRYRSEYNDKDLYRATLFGPRGDLFTMMFFQGGRAFTYACTLK